MIDGRLLLPAAAVWLGAAGCLTALGADPSLSVRHDRAVVVLVVGTLIGAGLGAVVLALVRQRCPIRWRTVAVVVVALAAGVVAAAAWIVRAAPQPVAHWIDGRATAAVTAVVLSEPETRTASGGRPWGDVSWVQARVRAESVSARGGTASVRVPILLRMPTGSTVPPPGSAVAVTGRLAPSDGRSGTVASLGARPDDLHVIALPSPVQQLAHDMRTGLRSALAGTAAAAGALVAGLAIGDESMQPPGLADAMRASGLAHLTAVSGGNVAIVMGVVLGLAAVARLRLWARAVLAALSLGFFVLLVGGQPSVLRAAVMGGAGLVAVIVGGRRAGPAVLGAAVVALVVLEPWLALSWGFALSVLATAGLVLLAPLVRGRLGGWRLTRRWPPGVLDALALTVAAQLATMPALVAMGAAVGWVSVPANLLAMPAVPPVTVLGLGAAALSVVVPHVAAVLARIASCPAGWIARVAETASALPGASLPWPSGWWGGVSVVASMAVLWAAHRLARAHLGVDVPRAVRAGVLVAVVIGVALVALVPPWQRGWPPPGWLMIMCDVGQGDALVLRSGPGRAVVVDTGPDPALVDGCLSDAGIEAVDAIVLSHFHADHVRGLAGVIRGRSVASVVATPVREPLEEAVAVDAALGAAGLRLEPIASGDVRRVGELTWRALWPRRRITSGSVPNNASVVLVVSTHGREIWLGGDVEPEAQSAMAPDLRALHLDVVKVPHHGSANQLPDLPVLARARVALISVGVDNDYGHPSADVVAAWERAGALVARTDEDGDVAVVATGSGVGVVTRRDMLRPS